MKKKEHKRLGIELFNLVWSLMEKKRRTVEEDDAMVHAAHASRHHWSRAGTAVNLARGDWQVSRVYCILGRPEGALHHARRCLEICRMNGLGDFDIAYDYEALARSAFVAKKKADGKKWVKRARAAGGKIKEKDDRDWFFKDLATLPSS